VTNQSTCGRFRPLAALVLLAASAALPAQDAVPTVWDAPWRVGIDFVGWLPSAPFDYTIFNNPVTGFPKGGGAPETLGNILSAMQMYLPVRLSVDKGRLGVFTDALYYKGKFDQPFNGALGEAREVTIREAFWLVDFGASWDLFRGKFGERPGRAGDWTLAPYAAGRWFRDNIRINTDIGILGDGLLVDTKVNVLAPVVGAKASFWANDDIRIEASADRGGWDVRNMERTWQFRGLAEYHFEVKDHPARVFAGYRYVQLNLRNEVLNIKVDAKGPFLGVGFDF